MDLEPHAGQPVVRQRLRDRPVVAAGAPRARRTAGRVSGRATAPPTRLLTRRVRPNAGVRVRPRTLRPAALVTSPWSRHLPRMLRRAIGTVLRPLFLAALRLFPEPDPWERLDVAAPLHEYGSGARRDFAWYFEGESAVTVTSLAEVRAWLEGCEYASDPQLFQESDFWQHPRTFEHLRRGDCEDFALWAWRKLVELGHDVDLVVGRTLPWEPGQGRHAWLVLRLEGTEYLYEPGRRGDDALRPLSAVKESYLPELGVGPDRKRFAFAGNLVAMRRWRGGAGKASSVKSRGDTAA